MKWAGDVRALGDRHAALRGWTRAAFATVLLVGGKASPAHANEYPRTPTKAYPGDLAHKTRVHFDLEAFYWVGAIGLPRGGNDLHIRNDVVGIFGAPRFPFGVGLGYGLSENMVVGARIDFSTDPHDALGPSAVTVRAGIAPYVQFMFMRDQHVRPFAQLRAGLGGGRTFVRVPGQRALESTGEAILYPLIGLGLGTHVFLSDEVSFDALVGLEHRWNVRRHATSVATAVEDVQVARWQLLDTSFSLAITFGFSRWF